MITEAEFLDALKLVKAYKLQVSETIEKSLGLKNTVTLSELKTTNSTISSRLHHTIGKLEQSFIYVDQINRISFFKVKGAGELTWKEFKKLRGY